MSEGSFHFSPRPNRANEILWNEWGPEAFAMAEESGKPVLLSLSAVWCHWCHVMDETTYSDPGVISFINERFVPVRVDNDQRPDINARYNMGGWPTTAFLTPEGEILAGATYIPPGQMKDALPKVYTHFVSNRDEITARAIELREARTAAYKEGHGAITPTVFDDVLRSVMNHYDPLYGGFGETPKFPHTDALDLLLYSHLRTGDTDALHMARKTLEMMYDGDVYDHEWDGFFRYATARDWSEPHYEKMLEDEAGLLRNTLALYRITRQEDHRRIAEGVIAYVQWKLRDPADGYFFGSQDADEEFYKLPAGQRQNQAEPYIDRTCYTAWNAQMISAYLEASWTLERDDLREAALQALTFLRHRCHDDGSGSMYRYHDGTPRILGLLADQSQTARALLDAYEVSADPQHMDGAVGLALLLETRFIDRETGGFWDVWDETEEAGRLKDRQKSVQENTVCAELFLRLGHMTREKRYLDIARATIEAFVGVYPQMGYFASGYAKQADIFLNPPVEVNIVGRPGAADPLQRAALSLESPSRTVQVLDPQRDAGRLASLFLPTEPSPAAYVCFGTVCSPPVSDPDQLMQTVQQMREASGPPRILQDD